MKDSGLAILMAMAALVISTASLSAQSVGQGRAVVTILPKHEGEPVPPSVAQQDLAVKVNGKNAKVTHWGPFVAPNNQIEMVIAD